MTVIGEAFLALRPDGSKFQGEAEKVVVPSLTNVAKTAASIIGSVALAAAVKKVATAGLEEVKEAQTVAAQTNAVLQSTAGQAGVSADHVHSLAEALLRVSGVDDELIQKGENVVLQFTNIRNAAGAGNDVFDRTIKDSVDMARALGIDVPSAASTLGIALQDPEQGMMRLRRAHVLLTDEQKASIKSFQDVGDVADAQKVILSAVEKQVGGSAEAYGKTLPGQIDIARESFKNAEGDLVAGLAPALKAGASGVAFLADAFMTLPEPVRAIGGGLTLAAVGALALAKPVGLLVDLLGKFKGAEAAAVASTNAQAVADAEAALATATRAKAIADTEAKLAALAVEQQAVTVTTAEGAVAEEGAAVADEQRAATVQALEARLALLKAQQVQATAATEAGAAASGAGEAAGMGLATGLGLVAAAVGVAAAAWYGYKHSVTVSVDAQKAAAAPTDELVKTYDEMGKVFGGLQDKFLRGLELGTLIRLRDALQGAGKDTTQLDKIIGEETGSQRQATADSQAATDQLDSQSTATDALATATQGLIDKVNAQAKAQQDAYDQVNGLTDASIRFSEAQQQLAQDLQDASTATDDQKTAQNEQVMAQDKAKSSVEALGQAAVDQYTQMAGSAATTSGKIAAQQSALEGVAKTLDPSSDLYKWLIGYIGALNTVPTHVSTVLDIYSHITGAGGSGIIQHTGTGPDNRIATGYEGWVPARPGGVAFTVAEGGEAEYLSVTPQSRMLGARGADSPMVWSGDLVVQVAGGGSDTQQLAERIGGAVEATLLRRRLLVHSRTGVRRR